MARLPIRRHDLVWLAPALAAGCVVYVAYLRTNPYPAHGAGLYLAMADAVRDHGYTIPRTVPHYSRGGIPFAYPPLAIYAVALVRDLAGVGPLALSRWLPGPLVVVSLVPTYFLAREVLESRPAAALAATLVAVNPQLIDWHLTAGGLVRAPAFLFTATGLYAGVRRSRSKRLGRRWLGVAIACFALTLLTHPIYATFFGVSLLVASLAYDRSSAGLADVALVGAGGVALAAPWWLTVVRHHGVDVFLGAMGTHGGIGGGLVARASVASLGPLELLLSLALGLSVGYGLISGRRFLAAWLVVVALLHNQPRFSLFVWSFLVAAVALAIAHRLRAVVPRPSTARVGPVLLLLLALVLGTLTGVGYVRDDTAAPRVTVTPDTVDGADLATMAWARSATTPGASFVVLGDASDWFPFFSRRTILVTPWGTEWEGARTYGSHQDAYRALARCDTERCLIATLERRRVRPDFVYVPTERYPVQGTPRPGSKSLARSLDRSDRYVRVFDNAGVTVFRRVPAGGRNG